MYSCGELFMCSWEGYFGVYFPPCAAKREINTKITLEWAHKQFVTRVHTLFYFLHDIMNPKMTLKTRILTHHPPVSLARFTLCWWRHSRLAMTSQWPHNCDANTWQVISNSLDIDFIHCDIHGRSCKKHIYADNDYNTKGMMCSSTHLSQRFSLTISSQVINGLE